ncbi:MAG TPA: aliphatic sulfonate ABC transporter substrate-binding protein [Polyangiales bacterium]|nr:aliphatic sulfonate ABC transporter substrate-binding protein [Polyangiales bacterium]
MKPLCSSLALVVSIFALLGCDKGDKPADKVDKPSAIRLDYATYNPVGLLLKDKHYLEDALQDDAIKVEWTKSLGSNKALEFLSSGSIDFGSTAGAAALLAKANGNPIRSVYVYSKPEWTALVTRPDSGISTVADLKGKKVAVTRGTDPFVFLLRALDSVGLSEKDVELVALQHPDGKAALERGDVDAWAGLDPLMATSELEGGTRLFFRKPEWNTYGVLNVREEFAARYPNYVDKVLTAYERARAQALAEPKELEASLIKEAGLKPAVATQVLRRTDISSSAIGDTQKNVILAAGDVLKRSAVIKAEADVPAVATALIDSSFVARQK